MLFWQEALGPETNPVHKIEVSILLYRIEGIVYMHDSGIVGLLL